MRLDLHTSKRHQVMHVAVKKVDVILTTFKTRNVIRTSEGNLARIAAVSSGARIQWQVGVWVEGVQIGLETLSHLVVVVC